MIDLRKGDCLELMKEISDGSIDLIVTDPPYNLTSRGCSGTMGGYWKEEKLKEKEDFLKNTNIESLRIEKQKIDELRRKVEQNDDINRKQLSDDFELIKQQIIDKLSEELIRWTEEYDIDNERSQGYMIGINKAKKIIKENMIFKLKTKSARLMRLLKESGE